MKYENIEKAIFLSRPNRFIANCLVDGQKEVCHVKNTGRCRELLTENATVYLEKSTNPNRKTAYDLVAVEKGGMLFNIDSQAPNKVAYEWLKSQENITNIKPECTYKNSRFDFYFEKDGRKTYMEVKGVTLEEDGVLLFPDAPTLRGVKHINELIEAKNEGFDACILFVVQTDKAKYFTPNKKTHPEFADALVNAEKCGVEILCRCCITLPDSLEISEKVQVRIENSM